jgi:hypothetical protein
VWCSTNTAGIEIYDRVAKNELGARRTPDFDLDALGTVTQQATGLPGKEFGTKAGTAVLDLGSPHVGADDARAIMAGISRSLLGDQAERLVMASSAHGDGQ